MDAHSDSLKDLLRRALRTQIDYGFEEVILDPLPAPPERPAPVMDSGSAQDEAQRQTGGEADSQAALFGEADTGNDPGEPEYESLKEHCRAICDCTNCGLGHTRTKFVYGVGHPNAEIMFVGEAPGAEEDKRGEPFVGRAGQLLDKILAAMGLSRDQVYITNILKCRPPNNRDPLPDEVEQCIGYLYEQIRLIRPKIICALGRVAAQNLLETTTPLGKLRKRWHEFGGTPMMVTYHPAALLRFQQYKRDTWEDMQMLMARLDEMKAAQSG
ncbi:uracil-DNA glycosylase [candidate division GN15 bacterium]|nr:uracil-DNA glycosylase [candidate division GN15 bacterium]